ncbi:MAG TPA: type II secretion system F family protein [Candidatus Andersenbacteria bacterium]|nr:type II secretion system F family protein [Candidatus Andersenbacteria bacterium]
MPIYTFTARNQQTGELISGKREASSHAVLGQDLFHEGILLTSFKEITQKKLFSFSIRLFTHVSILERVLFARYFALMLRAGLDMKSSLATLAKQTRNKALITATHSVLDGVERGNSLADSMRPHPNAFPDLFVSFVEVGEQTGTLQETFEVLSVQLQKEFELRRAVRGGMLYPIVIVSALFAVGVAMMIFVVPKLVDVFEGFDAELPLMTRILIASSALFSAYWYVVIIVAVLGAIAFWYVIKIPVVRMQVMRAMLFMPIVGRITKDVNVARFSRSLSSLLTSGIAFTDALVILGKNTPHVVYADVFIQAQAHVKQGKVLSDFFQQYTRLFPPLVVNIMGVGEQTGDLAAVLKEVASFYEGEVDQTMKNFTSIMEPVLMIVIGLGVGALAVSIISPIYSLVNVI